MEQEKARGSFDHIEQEAQEREPLSSTDPGMMKSGLLYYTWFEELAKANTDYDKVSMRLVRIETSLAASVVDTDSAGQESVTGTGFVVQENAGDTALEEERASADDIETAQESELDTWIYDAQAKKRRRT